MEGHRDLDVWQKAMRFVTDVYQVTQSFPGEERFGLSSQLRRAAISVPSNIAEGCGRSSTREFALFLCHARGSLLEVETQLEIARNLGYLPEDKFNEVLSESNRIGRMLNGLRSWCEAA